jgi:ABC-type lipoprotein release transport system permease subunit
MFKSLSQSLKALSANPVRTVLTTLGIVIGIATVIMVLSAGAGFQSLINDQIKSLGSDTLFIKTKVPPTTKNRAASSLTPGIAVGITTFKQRDLDDIKKLNNVVNDYGLVTGMAVTSYRDNQKGTIYYGSSSEKFLIDQHTLKEGRFYTQAEDSSGAQVVILGSKIASE